MDGELLQDTDCVDPHARRLQRLYEALRSLGRVAEQIQVISHLQSVLGPAGAHGMTDHLRKIQSLWSQIGEDRGVVVETNLDCAPAVPRSLSTPLALIVHEALTNCFEHPFPTGGKAT